MHYGLLCIFYHLQCFVIMEHFCRMKVVWFPILRIVLSISFTHPNYTNLVYTYQQLALLASLDVYLCPTFFVFSLSLSLYHSLPFFFSLSLLTFNCPLLLSLFYSPFSTLAVKIKEIRGSQFFNRGLLTS